MDDVDLAAEQENEGDSYDDEVDSDYFRSNDSHREQLNTSRMSNVSDGTFRDRELSEIDALKTMRIQSLTSIVNYPKKKTLIEKLGRMVKNNVQVKKHMNRSSQKNYHYKPLTEKDVPDNLNIPKVGLKDFEKHIKKTQTNAN
jgi:hypothetical protein